MYNIQIEPVLNGYVVRVGCQTVVFETTDKLLDELRRYMADPQRVEKEYQTQAINAGKLRGTLETAAEPAGPLAMEVERVREAIVRLPEPEQAERMYQSE